MIRAIFLFAVLGIGLFLGTQFSGQQGYVLISIADKTIEMSVTTLVIFMVALLAGLFSLEYLIKKTLYMSSTTWNWFSVRKIKRARRYTNEGIVKLLEGDWQTAEKRVTRLVNHHDMPLLCYLIASEAAHEMGDTSKRDKYLELAMQQEDAKLAVQLTKARQNVRDKAFEQALAELVEIKDDFPNNAMMMNLLKTVYIHLNMWQPLLEIMPKLTKVKLISQQEQADLFKQAQCGMIAEVASLKGSEGAIAHWNSLPRKLRQDSEIVGCLAKQLMLRHADSEAYTLVVEFLKKQRDDSLLALIPQMKLVDPYPAIVLLQEMIKKDENDASARSAIAQFYVKEQKWADAQQQLEKALTVRTNVTDYAQLAMVLEKQNLNHAAGDVSRKALTLINTP